MAKDAPNVPAASARTGERGPELLLIERAARDGDPWSGHMAFPGGRTEPGDADSFATAVRESREEIGCDITAAAGVRWLGRLDDLEGLPRSPSAGLRVTPHVCWLEGVRPELRFNHEVADALWVPMSDLADPRRHVDYHCPSRGNMRYAGIEVDGGRVVWGMTLRMLADLFSRIGCPLPLDLSPKPRPSL